MERILSIGSVAGWLVAIGLAVGFGVAWLGEVAFDGGTSSTPTATPAPTSTAAPTVSPSPTPTWTPPPTATAAPESTPTPERVPAELCREELRRNAEGALTIAWDGQNVHQEWIAYLGQVPDYDAYQVGDIPHHQRWVDGYQVIIDVLLALVEACGWGG